MEPWTVTIDQIIECPEKANKKSNDWFVCNGQYPGGHTPESTKGFLGPPQKKTQTKQKQTKQNKTKTKNKTKQNKTNSEQGQTVDTKRTKFKENDHEQYIKNWPKNYGISGV